MDIHSCSPYCTRPSCVKSKAETLAERLDFEYADNGSGYNSEWTAGLNEAAAHLRAQDALIGGLVEALEEWVLAYGECGATAKSREALAKAEASR